MGPRPGSGDEESQGRGRLVAQWIICYGTARCRVLWVDAKRVQLYAAKCWFPYEFGGLSDRTRIVLPFSLADAVTASGELESACAYFF